MPQDAARDHCAVVALYRSHLLYAIQVSGADAQLQIDQSGAASAAALGPQFPL